jgi:hypothetical protein
MQDVVNEKFVHFCWKVFRIKALIRSKCVWEDTIKVNITEVGTFKTKSMVANTFAATLCVLLLSDYLLSFF